MANSKTSVTEGSGKNIATYSFSEDATTKEVQRIVLNTNAGVEISPATEASQTTIIGHVDGIETALGTVAKLGSRVTPVDAVSASNAMVRFQDSGGNMGFLGMLPWVYNGTNFDMLRGSTSGLAVTAAQLPASVGIKADAASLSVTKSTEDRVVTAAIRTAVESVDSTVGNIEDRIGSTSSSAPTTDDQASVGLNGRMIRVAANQTAGNTILSSIDDTLIAGVPILDAVGGDPVVWSTPGINTEDNSDPVVLTSDQLALDCVTLADGSGSGANAVLFSIEAKGYRWINALCSSSGTSNNIRYQGSNDNTNWSTVGSISSTDGAAIWTSAHGPTAGVTYGAPVTHRYMRMIIASAGSGTVTVTPVLFNNILSPPMVSSVSPKLTTRTTDPGTNSSGTPVTPIVDALGKQVVVPYSLQASMWAYAAAGSGIVNTTTAVAFKASAGASVRNYITSIQIMSEVLGTATELAIRDGAGGTVLWRIKIPTTGLLNGLSINFPVPLVGTAATLLEVVTLTASGTGAVYFNAQGYVGP